MKKYPLPTEAPIDEARTGTWRDHPRDHTSTRDEKISIRNLITNYPHFGDHPDDKLPLSRIPKERRLHTLYRFTALHIHLYREGSYHRNILRDLRLPSFCTQKEIEAAYEEHLRNHPDKKDSRNFDLQEPMLDELEKPEYEKKFIEVLSTFFADIPENLSDEKRAELYAEFTQKNPDIPLTEEQFTLLLDRAFRERFLQSLPEALVDARELTGCGSYAFYPTFKQRHPDLVKTDYHLRTQLFRLLLTPLYRERALSGSGNKKLDAWHSYERIMEELRQTGDEFYPIALRYPTLLEHYIEYRSRIRSVGPIPTAEPVAASRPERQSPKLRLTDQLTPIAEADTIATVSVTGTSLPILSVPTAVAEPIVHRPLPPTPPPVVSVVPKMPEPTLWSSVVVVATPEPEPDPEPAPAPAPVPEPDPEPEPEYSAGPVPSSFMRKGLSRILTFGSLLLAFGGGVWYLSKGALDTQIQGETEDQESKQRREQVTQGLSKIASVDAKKAEDYQQRWDQALKAGDEEQQKEIIKELEAHVALVPFFEKVTADIEILKNNIYPSLADKKQDDWMQLWDQALPDSMGAEIFVSELENGSSFKDAQKRAESVKTDVPSTIAEVTAKLDLQQFSTLKTQKEKSFKILGEKHKDQFASMDRDIEEAIKTGDSSKVKAVYTKALKHCSELFYADFEAEVSTKLAALPDEEAKPLSAAWKDLLSKNDVLVEDEKKVYDKIEAAYVKKLVKPEVNPEVKPGNTPSGQTEIIFPKYTTTPWFTDPSEKGNPTCPDRGKWLDAWDKDGAVAVLMVVCKDGEVEESCPVYSKKNEKKASVAGVNLKKTMKIKPYGLSIDSYATVCAEHNSEASVVYKMQILGK